MRSLKSSPILHTHTQKKESWKRATDCLVSTGLCWDRRCVDPFGKPRLLTTIPPLASPTSALFPLEGLSGGALLWNPEWHFKVLSVSWDQVCISITGAVLLMTSHLDFGDLESYKGRDSNCWIVTSGRKETWEEKKKAKAVGGVWPSVHPLRFLSYFHSSGPPPLPSCTCCAFLHDYDIVSHV